MPPWAELARRARAKTGLTQVEFSKVIGASRATVAAWEAGLREPSLLSVSLLCLVERDAEGSVGHLRVCHARTLRRQPTST